MSLTLIILLAIHSQHSKSSDTDRDMQIEDEEWVTHTLKEYERRQCISKVLSLECKDAIPKGNNYASDMKRLSLKLVLKSGEIVTRSFILKAMPSTVERRNFVNVAGIFSNESKMFKEILPRMERLRAKIQGCIEPLTPMCYGIMDGDEGYLLEDLTVSGFKMVDRKKALDFQHGEIVMNALADFHASGKVLIENGDIAISDVSENFFLRSKDVIQGFITSPLETLITTIQEDWKGEWLSYVDKLNEYKSRGPDIFAESYEIKDSNFNTMTHGDCWMTNMMFRYDSSCKPQGHRFLDFQVSTYNSAGNDLNYFMNTSLNLEALKKKQDLLKVYYNKLIRSLELYGYSGVMPTFQDILDSVNASRMLGLMVGLTFRTFMMQEDESVPNDLEEFMREVVKNKTLGRKFNMNTENLRMTLQHILKMARNEGLI